MARNNDAITPKGKNTLGSRRLFEERKYYKNEVYEAVSPPIDFWYSRSIFGRYYGRLNPEGDTIYPVEPMLSILPSSKETILAFNFVVEAFQDLRTHLESLVRGGVVERTSFLTTLLPRRGWQNFNQLYHQHMVDVFAGFNGNFLKEREMKIETFEDFVEVFSEFLGIIIPSVPITKTFFATSHFCSPMISGLCVEISLDDHSKDEPKAEDYIHDINWDCYVEAAENFGFMIDKNAPWRLVADIESDVMKKYMNLYGFSNFFGKNEEGVRMHYLAHRIDYRALQIYLVQFYNSFVVAYPSMKKALYNSSAEREIMTVIHRRPMALGEFDQKYSKTELPLRLYAQVLKLEMQSVPGSGALPDKIQMNKNIKNALALQKVLDMNVVIDYIYLKTTGIRPVLPGFTNIAP